MHKNATKCNKTQSEWCINKHGASKIIDIFETYQCLDWAVANGSFSHLYEDCTVENLITMSSDHYAIMISLTKDLRRDGHQHVSSSFKYESMWRHAPDYKEVLEAAWVT
jgi:hypothetical protein